MEKLINILADVLEEDSSMINDKTVLKDLDNWDSMTHMFIITRLEKEYDIELESDEIVRMLDVATIHEIIKKKVK